MTSILPTALVHAVYDVLVDEAGASETWRQDFVHAHTVRPTCQEYRFQGVLGFGGKFWPSNWTVTCYPEDETPERLAVIARVNASLAELRSHR